MCKYRNYVLEHTYLCLQFKEIRLFDKGEMNTYHDVTTFASSVSAHVQQLLDDVFVGEAVPTDSTDYPDSARSAVLSYISSKYRSVSEELCTRLTLMTSPSLTDVYLKQSDVQEDYRFTLRKLKVLRVLVTAILHANARRDVTHTAQTSCDAMWNQEALEIADSVLRLLADKFRTSDLTMGETLAQEIVAFLIVCRRFV